MSKGQVTQMAVSGLAACRDYGGVVGQAASALGQLSTGVCYLASYSRDNEREADALGMEYMVKAGYSPDGFVGLMQMLKGLSHHKTGITELFFATHPMSTERYDTAVKTAQTKYAGFDDQPIYRERYMDRTAGLRKIKGAIDAMQQGSTEMSQERYQAAESQFRHALRLAPEDYAALVMMAKAMMLQDKYKEGLKFSEQAQEVYPGEAQAVHLSGMGKIRLKQYAAAYEDFAAYRSRRCPGTPRPS